MTNMVYEEHGFKAVIKQYKVVGPKLNGLRNGKPFIHKGELFINYEDNLCKVKKVKFTDVNGMEINQNSVPLDTDTAIRGVIVIGDEIILLHRVKKNREYYIFPGGHQIVNESKETALEREILEETGLNIKGCSKELLFVSKEENAGPEEFYLVSGLNNFAGLVKTNPDQHGDEINEILKINFKNFPSLSNVFPQEVFDIINNRYCK